MSKFKSIKVLSATHKDLCKIAGDNGKKLYAVVKDAVDEYKNQLTKPKENVKGRN